MKFHLYTDDRSTSYTITNRIGSVFFPVIWISRWKFYFGFMASFMTGNITFYKHTFLANVVLIWPAIIQPWPICTIWTNTLVCN